MKKILVLGAGRSSSVLISYLLKHAAEWDVMITVADHTAELAQSKVAQGTPHGGNHERAVAMAFDAMNEQQRKEIISQHDIVVSLLPPHLHILVAKDCIKFKKHLVTASYVTNEMQQLSDDVKKAGLLFMCEMGLDPGIDHMSAMKIIRNLQQQGGVISSFKSGTGGLVAPESDDNPWHYKVTWNPRNIVLAGQGTAQYLENGVKKFIPYHRLFTTTEKFKIGGYGKFESYPNRDSLLYISKYGLDGVKTILRSTLRKEGYCEAWNALIQLGLTDDTYTIESADALTYAAWLSSYLPVRRTPHGEKKKHHDKSIKERVARFFDRRKKDEMITRLEWLGLFSDEKILLANGTPAQILQNLIETKWMMQPRDNDLVVMRHEFEYSGVANEDTVVGDGINNNQQQKHISTLVLKGEDAVNTAMAKSVGLPLGIMVRLLLQHDLFLTGVHIPVMSQVYEPVLKELEDLGIVFQQEETARAFNI
ncbi:MAG TPA: saccharopine dehydrogenase C-terminal domain-containing protein [Chitinophagales bacterium]|nr:saccharopine dehydrogenase C-terminal domain-containing protein [Chitinophagales bacterium]